MCRPPWLHWAARVQKQHFIRAEMKCSSIKLQQRQNWFMERTDVNRSLEFWGQETKLCLHRSPTSASSVLICAVLCFLTLIGYSGANGTPDTAACWVPVVQWVTFVSGRWQSGRRWTWTGPDSVHAEMRARTAADGQNHPRFRRTFSFMHRRKNTDEVNVSGCSWVYSRGIKLKTKTHLSLDKHL